MRHRGRLDDEDLGLPAPAAARRARLVPDPHVRQRLDVPLDLEPLAGRDVRDLDPPGREALDREQARARLVESPTVGPLDRAVEKRRVGPAGRAGRCVDRAGRLRELVRLPAREPDLDFGLEQLEADRDVLDGDERRRGSERTPLDLDDEVAVAEREAARDLEPVPVPAEDGARGARLEHLPPVVRGAAVEAVPLAGDLARIARVRRDELPAATVALRPDVLGQVATERLGGGERRPAEELPARREVDEVEDLAAVGGVDADEEVVRAKDEHRGYGLPSRSRTTRPAAPEAASSSASAIRSSGKRCVTSDA